MDGKKEDPYRFVNWAIIVQYSSLAKLIASPGKMIYSTLETRHPARRVSLSVVSSLSLGRLSSNLFISLPLASLFPKLFLLFFFFPPFATIATLTSCLLRETRQKEGEEMGWRERERADKERTIEREASGDGERWRELERGRTLAY